MPGLPAIVKRNPLLSGAAAVAVVALGAWLAFGFFGFQTLLFDDEVDEAAPLFSSGAGASGLPSDSMDPETADAMNRAMAEEGAPSQRRAQEAEPMDAPEIVTVAAGDFVPRSHPGEGRAIVITDGSDERFLRFEGFETDNGPDLNVYLSAAAPDADSGDFDDDFVDLGDLKGNVGSQNYEIPPDVDLDHHSTVVVWCVRFGVAFTAAPLDPT